MALGGALVEIGAHKGRVIIFFDGFLISLGPLGKIIVPFLFLSKFQGRVEDATWK